MEGPDPTSLSASDFFATYTQVSEVWSQHEAILILSGTRCHLVDTDEIPAGCTGVDVLLDDNGEELKCMMTAGLFGTEIITDAKGRRNTVRPVSGWWMFEKVAEGEEGLKTGDPSRGCARSYRCRSSNASEQQRRNGGRLGARKDLDKDKKIE